MGVLKGFWYPVPNLYRRQACAHPRKLNIKAPKFVGIPPSEKTPIISLEYKKQNFQSFAGIEKFTFFRYIR